MRFLAKELEKIYFEFSVSKKNNVLGIKLMIFFSLKIKGKRKNK